MAGSQCPFCGEMTFFRTPTGGKCSKCGMTAHKPANGGKGGQGRKCPICKERTVFIDGDAGSCRTCGTTFS